jgi:NADH oxidase (H2O-forming)
MSQFSTLKVNDNVTWVGVLDRNIVTFDIVMETQFGTTYNSYFINADKKTIIDTTKETFWDEYLTKLRLVVNPSEIEVIVINHTEPDHSGNIKNLLEIAPKAKVYGSRQAINYLNEIINQLFPFEIVKDNDTLSLGNKTLRFVSAPNLHWPDTMYTYLEEDNILFTCDSFAAHYADERMFDNLIGDYSQAFDYYFNIILRPFSKFMLKAIERIEPLQVSTICPGHGPIILKNAREIIEKTKKLAEMYLADTVCVGNNVLITYVSAYGFTKKMAETIAVGLRDKIECEIKVVDIENILLGELEEMITRSNALLIGSPTINQNTVLPVYKLFSLINPIRDKGKKAAAFGSYGWSGEAVKLIEEHLRQLKLNVVLEGVSSRFAPGEGTKAETLKEFGRNFALELLKE